MRRTRTALASSVVAALLLAGCGDDDPTTAVDPGSDDTASASTSSPAEDESPTESHTGHHTEPAKPRPAGPFADLTFDGDTSSPNGERVELEVGQALTLRISSDRPGELHVHSTPEQEISFPAGQSERKLVIEQPGVVDVEDHESGMVLLQLEVH